jgi:hypothetical protein
MFLTRDQLAELPAEEAAAYVLDNPGSLSKVLQTDPDRTADPQRWAVPALPANVETTQISLRIPTALLAHFDHIAATGPSRSDLIRAAMIEFLAHRTAVPLTDAAVEAALSIVESVVRGRVAVTHVDVADAA